MRFDALCGCMFDMFVSFIPSLASLGHEAPENAQQFTPVHSMRPINMSTFYDRQRPKLKLQKASQLQATKLADLADLCGQLEAPWSLAAPVSVYSTKSMTEHSGG